MAVLLVADHTNSSLGSSTAKALTAARALGADVHILIAGHDCQGAAAGAAKLSGVAKVLVADAAQYAHGLAEEVAPLVVSLMANYDVAMAAGTTAGKNLMPRVAALLDVMQISDIIAVKSADTFERPIYAGNAIQTVQATDAKKVITVRTAAFAVTQDGGSAAIEAITALGAVGASTFESAELTKSDRPELTAAKIIISGGRGMGNGENFAKYIEPIADNLGAAMGASRAAKSGRPGKW
jgi:electron transfer flavoprotein alpha subunit